jgi:hypothetical protein
LNQNNVGNTQIKLQNYKKNEWCLVTSHSLFGNHLTFFLILIKRHNLQNYVY